MPNAYVLTDNSLFKPPRPAVRLCFACCAAGKGATVIQLGGGTRELYYYPKNTMTVINVGENVNKGEMHNATMSVQTRHDKCFKRSAYARKLQCSACRQRCLLAAGYT